MLQAQMDKEAQIRRRLQEVRGRHSPCATCRCREDALPPTCSVLPLWVLLTVFCRLCLQLDGELEAALGLLDAIVTRNPCGLTQYIPVLVDAFLPLLKSPLAARRVKGPFLSLAACVMPPRLKALG